MIELAEWSMILSSYSNKFLFTMWKNILIEDDVNGRQGILLGITTVFTHALLQISVVIVKVVANGMV